MTEVKPITAEKTLVQKAYDAAQAFEGSHPSGLLVMLADRLVFSSKEETVSALEHKLKAAQEALEKIAGCDCVEIRRAGDEPFGQCVVCVARAALALIRGAE